MCRFRIWGWGLSRDYNAKRIQYGETTGIIRQGGRRLGGVDWGESFKKLQRSTYMSIAYLFNNRSNNFRGRQKYSIYHVFLSLKVAALRRLLLLLLLWDEVSVAEPEDLPHVYAVHDVNVRDVLGGEVHVVHAEAHRTSAREWKTNVTFATQELLLWGYGGFC